MNGRRWLACRIRKAGSCRQRKTASPGSTSPSPAIVESANEYRLAYVVGRMNSDPVEDSLLERPIPIIGPFKKPNTQPTSCSAAARTPLCRVASGLHDTVLLHFVNYSICKDGTPHPQHPGEVKTTIDVEGLCVRHRIHGNLLKMYQMGGVRVESMLHDIHHFRTFRDGENGRTPALVRIEKAWPKCTTARKMARK